MSILVAGLSKIFMGELIEEAKLIQVDEQKAEILSQMGQVSMQFNP